MVVNPLDGYRMWAPTYDVDLNPLLALERRTLIVVLGNGYGRRIVDVACGTGYWARRLGESGSQTVGFDFCEEMVMHGYRNGGSRACLLLADATFIPLRTGWADLTLCSLAFSYFSKAKQVLFEMSRVTREGGRVVVSDMHPEAIAAGWQRSFQSDGVKYEIAQTRQREECIARLACKAGLRLLSQTNARFGEEERALFLKAGRADLFAQATQFPAIQINNWIRQ
jgi:ubiquinone/menaquinone biosynthesis C-methylase UbiE